MPTTNRPYGLTLLAAAVAVLPASGCTLEDGTGFGRLSARLWSRFEGLDAAAGRLTADGWYRTNTSFELKLTTLTLDVEELQVVAIADAATTVASVLVPSPQDLLGDGTRVDLSRCRPSCELDAGRVDGVRLVLGRLALKARLRDGSAADRLQGAELALALDRDLAGLALGQTLSSPEAIDRDHPYLLDLTLVLPVTAGALDDVEWHQLQRSGGTIKVDASTNSSAGEAITSNLSATTVKVSVTRAED